jgi:hypothetical protein
VKLLNGTLELHDVKDVEATCRSILERALLSRNVSYLDVHEYEDALSFFVNTAYEFSLKYDPERVRNEDGTIGMSFSTYLHRFLPARLADWYRQRFVDIRYVEAPTLVDDSYAEFEVAYASRHSWGAGGDSSSHEEVIERGVLVATVQTYSTAPREGT